MSPLNENQIRRVVVTFSQVDALLDEVERLARSEPGALVGKRADFSENEARPILAAVKEARAGLLDALDRMGIPRPKPTASARWAARANLTFADIALSDLSPSNLKGYGDVDAVAAAELVAHADDLRSIITRARSILEHGARP